MNVRRNHEIGPKRGYALFLALLLFIPQAWGQADIEAVPRSLDDGDTYVMHFRSQGIDTPEKKQLCERNGACYPCGQEATKALKALTMEGRKFKRLRFKVWTTGRYGRPIVTAYDGEKDIHLELVRQGWAVAYRKYLPAELAPAYLAAEAEAKEAGRGLWAGEFIMPSKWRRGKRLACEKQ
jgi:endonuclease YncB( thermonuclease family)